MQPCYYMKGEYTSRADDEFKIDFPVLREKNALTKTTCGFLVSYEVISWILLVVAIFFSISGFRFCLLFATQRYKWTVVSKTNIYYYYKKKTPNIFFETFGLKRPKSSINHIFPASTKEVNSFQNFLHFYQRT